MPCLPKKFIPLLLFLFSFHSSFAQTEFPSEFIAHVRIGTGTVTNFHPAPDLFTGSLQIIPQYTLAPHKIRGGAVAGFSYVNKKIIGVLGPTVSFKLTEFQGGYFASVGNVHLTIDHLWGTEKQRLLGGGFNIDLLNKLILGLSAHRDYKLNNWWLQSSIAFRISSVKKPDETFPH